MDFFYKNIKNKFSLILVALFFLLSGCAGENLREDSSYYDVLDENTETLKIYSGVELVLHLSATLKSKSFRAAYAREYSKRFKLDSAKTDVMKVDNSEALKEYVEFFFSAHTPDPKWNDFEEKDSIWKLYLSDSTKGRVIPFEIKKLEEDSPALKEFFPYIDAWSKVYSIKFPLYHETGEVVLSENLPLKLTIAGVKGEGELLFEMY
ncbi:MAG: hypothetical protein KAT46_06930 [Deltaproteobacteria bacterium]|nr:hypothetical protein [Deltaproteobacteria bacterium]